MLTLFYQMKTKKKSKLEFVDFFKDALENMEFRSKGDLSTKCRVCLQESTPIQSQNDFEEISELLQLFGINLIEDDDYPKNLCSMCYKFITVGILFRKAAKNAEEILKQPVKEEDTLQDLEERDYSDGSVKDGIDEKWEDCSMKRQKKVKIKYNSKVTCHICNKVMNKSYYKEHMTMHDPDHKKYVCDICGKSFRLRCAYHNHSLRHRTDFAYKCQFCPYKGRYSELLKTHMRTHTGDYRYMCTECPARFLFKSNLNSHMLKHKEPKFKCEACKRAFHSKLMLQRHYEADHLGIKNHVCSLCGKAFGYRNAMMKHQRHVHKRAKMLFGRMPTYLQEECEN